MVATPWDQALANRVPLNLGAVASSTLDAKLAMAEVVLRSADRANRRRQGLPEGETENSGNGHWDSAEPTRWLSEPLPPDAGPDSPDAEPDTPDVRNIPAGPDRAARSCCGRLSGWPDTSDVRIIPAGTGSDGADAAADSRGRVAGNLRRADHPRGDRIRQRGRCCGLVAVKPRTRRIIPREPNQTAQTLSRACPGESPGFGGGRCRLLGIRCGNPLAGWPSSGFLSEIRRVGVALTGTTRGQR